MKKQSLTKEEKKQARALRDLKKGKRNQWVSLDSQSSQSKDE